MPRKRFKVDDKFFEDNHISTECKIIYSYLHGKGFEKTIFHFNIGEIQNDYPITNVGFRKNLKILEKFKLLVYNEYKGGRYEIHIY